MDVELTFYLQIAVAIFTILDPLGALPVFLLLTDGNSEEERRIIVRRTVIAVALILLIAALAGNRVLAFFGIDIHAFQTAGGILLLLIALNMLQARGPLIKTTSMEREEAIEKEDVSVVPLAMPLLAGPGSISTVIVFSASMQTLASKGVLLAIILAVVAMLWPILLLCRRLGERIGRTGINIAVRIMGLILASIAVKFILEGARAYLC